MQFSAMQDHTAQVLQQVIRVIKPQNTMAVLTGIELHADHDRLTLSATDLSSHIVADIPCDVQEPGSVVLPASTLTALIQRLPTATFALATEEPSGRATLRYGRNKAVIHGFGRETLPLFPPVDTTQDPITLAPGTIATLSRQLLFACAKDSARPILQGMAVTLGHGRLVMIATDGSRLSHSWVAVPDYRGPVTQMVVPSKVLSEGARLNASEPVTLTLGSGLIQLAVPGVVLTARLLDGQFPEVDHVMPQEFIAQCRLSVLAFRGAVERVHLIAAKERSTPLRLRLDSGILECSTEARDIGQAQETLECETHGEPIDLLFNPAYILDALKSCEADEAVIEFSGRQSPARLREAEGAQYSHILLPLRQLVPA